MASKTTALMASIAVILLALNVFQYYYFNYLRETVLPADVPVQIMDVKGENWQNYIDKRATIEGFYFAVRGDYPILVSNLDLLYIREAMPNDKFMRLNGTIPQALQPGDRYYIKGTAKQSEDENEKLFLIFESYKLVEASIRPPKLEAAYHITLTAQPQPAPNKFAVLISGGINAGGARIAFWNDLKYTYSILANKYGYNRSNIIVVYKDGIGEDAEMPVNYSATRANVLAAFTTLQGRIKSTDSLFISVSNHGGSSGSANSYICLYYDQSFTDSDLATALGTLSFYKLVLVMDICRSGGFIDNISGTNRLVVTACMHNQSSFDADTEGPFGEFTYHFMSALNKQTPDGVAVYADTDGNGWISIGEAFNYATTHISTSNTPLYDDNGDHTGHTAPIPNGGDGGLANTYP